LFKTGIEDCLGPLKPIVKWLCSYEKELKHKYRLFLGFGVAGLIGTFTVTAIIVTCHLHPAVVFQVPCEVAIGLIVVAGLVASFCFGLITGAITIDQIRTKLKQGRTYIEAQVSGIGKFFDSWLNRSKDELQLLNYLDEKLGLLLANATEKIFYSPDHVKDEIHRMSKKYVVTEINTI